MTTPTQLSEQVEALAREVSLMKRQRAGSRWLFPLIASLVLAGVALAQPALTSFQADQPARAAEVNGNFASLAAFTVPPGAVMLFDLATCPAGWTAYAPGRAGC